MLGVLVLSVGVRSLICDEDDDFGEAYMISYVISGFDMPVITSRKLKMSS